MSDNDKHTLLEGQLTDKEIRRRRLKFYLGIFWVKPNPSETFKKQIKWLHDDSKQNKFQPVFIQGLANLKQAGQAIILTYGKEITWRAFNTYELVDKFIQGESIPSLTEPCELLILYHGVGEMPNRQLHNISNQVIESRTMKNKRTVLLSTKQDKVFGFGFRNMSQACGASDTTDKSYDL